MSRPLHEDNSETLLEERVDIKKPPRYLVILHNDDYTTMDFVVFILKTVFGKSQQDAVKIMIDVHQKGSGVAGVYSREIAETKIDLVHKTARENGFPLRCSLQKE
jgi:ATP-dependent Clp protease adaptor protein ClpS